MKYVAYYRISKPKVRKGIVIEASTDYSIEAQQVDIARYINSVGGEMIAEFTEVESGGKNDRPILIAAIKQCKANDAYLVVSRLDRLTRELSFLSVIKREEVKFICADNPEYNWLVINILTAVAQNERESISVRTKKALAIVKARRGEWRVCNFTHEGRVLSAKTKLNNYLEYHKVSMLFVLSLLNTGLSVGKVIKRYNESYLKEEYGPLTKSRVRAFVKYKHIFESNVEHLKTEAE